MIKNLKIFISGGAGSIASELIRQLAPNNEIYTCDINETELFNLYEEMKLKGLAIKTRVGDICNRGTLEDIFYNFQPNLIIHSAARKHVSPMELDPIEAVQTNIIGTNNLIRAAKKYKIEKFINISTDKVNGESIMGLTKKIAERIVQNAGYVSVRFGNVLGSRGSLLPIWQKQIDQNQPVTVTDGRMQRYFMSLEEACSLVIEACEIGEGGDKIILDMGKQHNILELAKEILKKSGKDLEIKIIGAKSGEMLQERLMNEDEEKRAVKKDRFWIIKPN